MFDQGGGPHGNALAAGSILVSLIDALVEKGVLSKADVKGLLGKADDTLKPKSTIVSVDDARAVIAALAAQFDR